MHTDGKPADCPHGKCDHSAIVHRQIKNEQNVVIGHRECAVCASKKRQGEPGDHPCSG